MLVNEDNSSYNFYITYLISYYPLLPQPLAHPFSFSPPFSLSLSLITVTVTILVMLMSMNS